MTTINWFECKVQSVQMQEDGTNKKVVESYLTEAEGVTDAERRVTSEVGHLDEFEVISARKIKISEIFEDPNHEGKWFKAKVMIVTLDERSGAEKKTPTTSFIQSDSLQNAVKYLDFGVKDTMNDWEVAQISETPVVEVFYNIKND